MSLVHTTHTTTPIHHGHHGHHGHTGHSSNFCATPEKMGYGNETILGKLVTGKTTVTHGHVTHSGHSHTNGHLTGKPHIPPVDVITLIKKETAGHGHGRPVHIPDDIIKLGPNPQTWSHHPHQSVRAGAVSESIFPIDVGSTPDGTSFHINQPTVHVSGNFGDPMQTTITGGFGAQHGNHSVDVTGGSSFYGSNNIPGSNWGGVQYQYKF